MEFNEQTELTSTTETNSSMQIRMIAVVGGQGVERLSKKKKGLMGDCRGGIRRLDGNGKNTMKIK